MGTSGLVPKIKDGDWVSVRQAIAKLSVKLGPVSNPTYAGLTLTGLTASKLLASDASKALVSSDLASWVAQTANQVLVADDGDGSITLSTPQDIHTGASPLFAGVKFDLGSGNAMTLTGQGGGSSTLTLDTNDVNRTLTLSGNPTIGDWFDQSVKSAASPTFVRPIVSGIFFDFTQNYIVGERATLLTIQGQTNDTICGLELFTKKGDGGDAVSLNIWGYGTPASATDRHLMQVGYTGSGYVINTQANIQAVPALSIYTGANTTQLVLATNNNISMSGALRVTGDVTVNDLIIGDARFIGSATTPSAIQIEADGDIVLSGNFFVPQTIFHVGDGDTGIFFAEDTFFFQAGGLNMFKVVESVFFNEVVVNENQLDIDFKVESDSADDLFFCDASADSVGIGTKTPTTKFSVNEKSGMTPIGGYAVKLTNKTGANSVAGELVNAHTSVENAVEQTAINDTICIGAFLESGIADGSEAWVVVGGIVQVKVDSSTTVAAGDWVKVSSNDAGRVESSGSETPGANHFREVGHAFEAGGNDELIKISMHFN